MHSVHQAAIRTHNGTANTDQIIAHDHHLHHHHQQQQQQDKEDLSSMTILKALEPVQSSSQQQQQQQPPPPVLSSLDPVQEQRGLIHHSPHLHELHSSSQELQVEQDDQQQQQRRRQRQQQQRQRQEHDEPANNEQRLQRPAAQLVEGIVAEGGGPIVQWLLDNYEIAEGDSLPRSTVYNHYLAHCKRMRMSSVNAASFGKLIRSVFVGLKTRRLGTRGHSKYHYFGVRAKQHVRLEWLSQGVGVDGQATGAGCSSGLLNENSNNGTDGSESDSTGDGGRSSSMMSGSNKRFRRTNNESDSAIYGHHQYHRPDGQYHQDFLESSQNAYHAEHHSRDHQDQLQATANGVYYHAHGGPATNGYDKQNGAAAAAAAGVPYYVQTSRYDHYDLSSFRNHLGANKASLVDEHWPERDANLLERVQKSSGARDQTNNLTSNHHHLTSGLVDTFESQYKSYYKRMVEFLGELQFSEIEHLTMDFWHPAPMPAAHETIHWTSTTTSAVSTPSGPCEVASPSASTNGTHHVNYDQQDSHHHHHHLLQQQQDHQMMYQNVNSLTFEQLYQIASHPVMIERINQIDCRLYSVIESFLVVDMLNPLPRPLVHHLQLFARNICSWIEQAVKEYPAEFINEKMKSTRAFEQALRRSTSVNHLATASRSIWSKRAVMHQMSSDLSRLDLRDIELQVASLMTSQEKSESSTASGNPGDEVDHQQRQHLSSNDNGRDSAHQAEHLSDDNKQEYPSSHSNDNIENHYADSNHGHNAHSLSAVGCGQLNDFSGSLQPGQLIQNLLHLLENAYPAEAWPNWCQTLVESRVSGQSYVEARGFILKWNFYISLISRELTLKSAPSLGSFQLIRLLFDEYMFYLVVRRLAQVQQKTPTQLLRPSVRYENI